MSIAVDRAISQEQTDKNYVNPDEMAHYELSYLDVHCLKSSHSACRIERVKSSNTVIILSIGKRESPSI